MSDGTGMQGWFSFGLMDGSDQFLNVDYYFGWYDGNAANGAAPGIGVPNWSGYGAPGTGQIITVAGDHNNVVSAGNFFSHVGGPSPRTYSVQFKLDQADVIPEPSSFAVWCALGLIGIGVGWRRRRKAA